MKRIICLCFIISFVACSSDSGPKYVAPKFPVSHEVKINILTNNLILRARNHMCLYDQYIILPAQSVNNNNVFQVFSIIDGTHLSGFAYHGRSGNDLVDYLRYCVDSATGMLYALDNTNKLIGIDL
jgi:hypothetical protein